MATLAQEQRTLAQRLLGGVLGGVAGGLVFGALMALMGMLPMIARLVGSDSAAAGFAVHLVLSAIIGAGFGLIFGARVATYREGALWGLAYGAIWWVLGPLVIMPLMMGMGLQFGMAFTPMMLQSLMGHLLFGLVTGAVCVWYTQRR